MLSAFLVAVLFGIVITAVQGALVGYIRANPLLVQLIAALSLLIGGALARDRWPTHLFPGGEGLQVSKGASPAYRSRPVFLLATVLIGQLTLSWTRIGREMVMVGEQPACRDRSRRQHRKGPSPLPTCLPVRALPYPHSLAARYGLGDMELGLGYDYTAIAAVLVGGTAIGGGSGSVVRTLVGVTVIAVIATVLLLRIQPAVAISDHRPDRPCGHHAPHHRGAAMIRSLLLNPTARPFTVMAGSIVVLALIDRGTGFFFSVGTIFSVMQLFATFGLVALGLGLSILIREFDLSVAGIVGLAGCIAVMTGAEYPWLGLLLGVGAGLLSGLIQGFIVTELNSQLRRGNARWSLDVARHDLRSDR